MTIEIHADSTAPSVMVRVDAPRIEHLRTALGTGERCPRLSWTVAEAPSGWRQTEVEVRSTSAGGEQIRRLDAADGVLVDWPFAPLDSRQRVEVSVRVGDGVGFSSWSAPTTVEAGLLNPTDWTASAIGLSPEIPDNNGRPVLLRTDIVLAQNPLRARLYATAHGLYQFEINGRRVADDELAPGWTSYRHRLRYVTYDVTDELVAGPNAVGAWLADGWYRGRLGFDGGYTNLYGDQTALLAQLEIEYGDGTTEVFGTGSDWSTALSPITVSSLLEGERFDARLHQAGWSRVGFAAEGWAPAGRREIDVAILVAPSGPPVRCIEEVAPVSSRLTSDGRLIVDFGQNLVGRLQIAATAEQGHTVRLRHAEVLGRDGELETRPLRGAFATDEYVFAGDGEEVWQPRFTIHGFRYAEITSWPGDTAAGIVAQVLHTDMRRTGTFESSDPRLNRLHGNVVWSMRGNFVDLPTDCPQRDERLGWTGDIQVFAPTANYLYDCAGLLSNWLQDLAAEQLPDGTVPWYVPVIPGGDYWTPIRPGAGWGDAAVLVPWAVFFETGDLELLRRQFDSARAWSDLQHELSQPDNVWDGNFQLGDWLDPSAPPDDPAHGLTDPNLVATAYYARSAQTLARIAEALGRNELHDTYRDRAAAAREGFRGRYIGEPGVLVSESQAAYALAIVFELFDENELDEAGNRLAQLIRDAAMHLTTGFLGTPLLLDALTLTGHEDVALALLNQDTVPSWLYAVSMGATSVWERWDSMLPNGDVNPGDMTSFNHYAFGAVADWMHRRLAGLSSSAPAWGKIVFQPGLSSGLSSAAAEKITPHGLASISWSIDGDCATIDMVVPIGTTASLALGDGVEPLEPGKHQRLVLLSSL